MLFYYFVFEFTFGHEIGHNLRLNHDRGTEDACNGEDYNYGYRDSATIIKVVVAHVCKDSPIRRMTTKALLLELLLKTVHVRSMMYECRLQAITLMYHQLIKR